MERVGGIVGVGIMDIIEQGKKMYNPHHYKITDIDDIGKIIRSIELSCDAVKNGADPHKALAQIKDKCRNFLRG